MLKCEIMANTMPVKKLSEDIQRLIYASVDIRSYKTAVEELVYNALDADSTSIAVRIDIENNSIQVLDNGCGISQRDFNLLGERYATSKCVDLSTLKSVPNKYGFRGQFLSSLIQVSRNVKITSRSKDSEETWYKYFDEGKEIQLSGTTYRASKGTTVEIKGFLYNLEIRKNAIDALQELRDIKTFLEQLSLVHSNISISLRDDSNNDIPLKLHKNRDIYQTLSTLFGVDRSDVQELIVEKNLYKATAYIGKMGKDLGHKHLIYLNRKLTQNTKLSKTINDSLIKTLHLNATSKKKIKSKAVFDEEESVISGGQIPFYVIFITCPYYDYDISYTPKHSMLEFKNWEHVKTLLEKVVKFYTGDMNLREIKHQNKNPEVNDPKKDDDRDKIRKIVEKMLGNTIRRPGVSQMQNGVKGKLIKRKPKKYVSTKVVLPLSKALHPETSSNANIHKHKARPLVDDNGMLSDPIFTLPSLPAADRREQIESPKVKIRRRLKTKKIKPAFSRKTEKENSSTILSEVEAQEQTTIQAAKKTVDTERNTNNKIKEKLTPCKPLFKTKKKLNGITKANQMTKAPIKLIPKGDPLLQKFENQTNSVKRKCDLLAKNIEDLLIFQKRRKREALMNEPVQYSSVTQNHNNIPVHQRINEIVVQDCVPRAPSQSLCTFDNRNWNGHQKNVYRTTYDLLQTILSTQHKRVPPQVCQVKQANNCVTKNNSTHSEYFDGPFTFVSSEVDPDTLQDLDLSTTGLPQQTETRLTYESHHYGRFEQDPPSKSNAQPKEKASKNFITTHSKENFVREMPKRTSHFKIQLRKRYSTTSKQKLFQFFKRNQTRKYNVEESDYTIDFSRSKEALQNKEDNNQQALQENTPSDCRLYETYTIIEQSNTNKVLEIGNSFTIASAKSSHQIQVNGRNHASSRDSHRTYYVQDSQKYVDVDGIEPEIEIILDNTNDLVADNIINQQFEKAEQTDNGGQEDNMKSVPAPKSQTRARDQNLHLFFDENNALDQNIDPQFWKSPELKANEGRCNDTLFNDEFDLDSFLCDRNIYMFTSSNSVSKMESHSALNGDATAQAKINNDKSNTGQKHNDVEPIEECEIFHQMDKEMKENQSTNMAESKDNNNKTNIFRFKNRPRFVPKGLSPIFENCRNKTSCNYEYELDKDYYGDSLYDNFANKVQAITEIYGPKIQNVKELLTRDIEKVNCRLDKDNASLIFDGESLKNTLVLGQVDQKFIAAKIKSRSEESRTVNESLVLFDQHAVHERIRLEKNLSDYFNGQQWKSTSLDEVTMKLSKSDVMYLHNYKEKFMQFGLEWSISDCEVSITAIPEAILGKNPRQVEVIVKTIKNLIAEEINAIETQKGCISLYPKSIMELVFSEACRYAIKFGDRLSKTDCQELIHALSLCKTPFQCAHGRPVMAVLIDVKKERREYKANPSKILQFFKNKKNYY